MNLEELLTVVAVGHDESREASGYDGGRKLHFPSVLGCISRVQGQKLFYGLETEFNHFAG